MNDEIKTVLSGYINERDNAKKSSPFYIAGENTSSLAVISRFNGMVNSYHMRLAEHLPTLNIGEMEALSELINSRLNWMRMEHNK